MALGDGIRRNIASVDPAERRLLRDALIELNRRFFPGSRTDSVPGGVSWWFKQDEIHHTTHIHMGPEFVPWHREIVNRFEEMLRQINPQLSLHYWDWTQDPRAIPNANLGGGSTGILNLFTSDFMGYGGPVVQPINEPWLSAGYYVPNTNLDRDVTGNPADPPRWVTRSVEGSPASATEDQMIVAAGDFTTMRTRLQSVHDRMHNFVSMGGTHISFRDPFVFLLHSNVDRLFALWQTQRGFRERLDPNSIYGTESNAPGLNQNVEPWSTGHSLDEAGIEHLARPWFAPENQGTPKTYKHPSIVTPPNYDTNVRIPVWVPFHGSNDKLVTLAVGRNLDGRLEVFGTRSDDTIWHTWQTAPNSGWSSWQLFHANDNRLRTLAVGRNKDGRLEVFGIRSDDTIWHTWQTAPNSGWSSWAPFYSGGERLRTLVVGQNLDGRLEVFGTRADDTIWHKWQTAPNSGWSAWAMFHSNANRLRTLAVGRNKDGRLEVFGTRSDDTIWHTWQTAPNSGWSPWAPFYSGGERLRKLVVGQNLDGRLEVFGTKADDTIWHKWQTAPNSGWSTWASFHSNGDRLRTLAVGRNLDGRLEVFGTNSEDTIWHTFQTAPNSGWSPWQLFHANEDKLSTLAVGQNSDGRLEVFGAARNQTLWHTWQTAPSSGWNLSRV